MTKAADARQGIQRHATLTRKRRRKRSRRQHQGHRAVGHGTAVIATQPTVDHWIVLIVIGKAALIQLPGAALSAWVAASAGEVVTGNGAQVQRVEAVAARILIADVRQRA